MRASLLRFALLIVLGLPAPWTAHAQTGLVPITDLGPGTYSGFQGGLYPGGVNTPPPAHLDSALARAARIVPRDATGQPSPHGWIGMIAAGMSNTTHEFGAFERNADTDTTRNARVVLIDTGFGGQTATVLANPAAPYWTTMSQRIAAMGLTAEQVQVCWLKEAEAQPANNFPVHARALRDTLKRVVRNLRQKFPNLQICYVSSRIYGGWSAQGTLNPEPQAYESGFSVKWLIEDQIAGDPTIHHGQLPGAAEAPLLLWGPYLWADGPTPRSDGLTWPVTDFEGDHVHPAPSGEQKVAGLLADFFAHDPTAAAWWPAQPGTGLQALDATADAYVSAAFPDSSFGADALLYESGGATPRDIYVRFDATAVTRPILLAKLSLRVDQNGGGLIRRVDDASWPENSLTYDSAPPIGSTLVTLPQSSRDGTLGASVTEIVRSDADGQVAFGLTLPATGPGTYHSREAGQPPRLIVVVSTATTDVPGPQSTAAGLRSVSPNPSAGVATLSFALARAGHARLTVHSIDGRRVRTLRDEWLDAGAHTVSWNGLDAGGTPAPPGVYWVRFAAAGVVEARRIVRLR